MTNRHEKMKSDLSSTIGSLMASNSEISCSDASQRIYVIATDYFKACAQPSAPSAADEDTGDAYLDPGDSIPGISEFFWYLWEPVMDHVLNAPVEAKAHHEHMIRLVRFVGETTKNPQPDGDWLIGYERRGWKDLPSLGIALRAADYDPIEERNFEPLALVSPESQAALAGATHNHSPESVAGKLENARNRWLSLQSFMSRLWGDGVCDHYACSAIWVLRSGLEDWPDSPPSYSDNYKESPAYLAREVEAAAIWICNTASLMYKCTEIWGPNGNPDWPENAGLPGRGGRRWTGVDGFDREHKRWQLWKDMLGEVIQWCDSRKGQMEGWKVRDAAVRALEAMREAERE